MGDLQTLLAVIPKGLTGFLSEYPNFLVVMTLDSFATRRLLGYHNQSIGDLL